MLIMTPKEYFTACLTFNRSINQISPCRNFSFTAESRSCYSDWVHLLIAGFLDLPNAFKEGGVWVGTSISILVDLIVLDGLSNRAGPAA